MSVIFRREMPRGSPELSFLGFDLGRLMEKVRSGFPTLSSKQIEIWLQSQPTLACVTYEGDSACIRLHSVLNHPNTPERVISFILGHEMLHLVIAPREIDGERKSHPPEFWVAERELFPDRVIAWGWTLSVLGSCLRVDKKQECTFVKRNWKRLMKHDRPTLEQMAAILESRPLAARESKWNSFCETSWAKTARGFFVSKKFRKSAPGECFKMIQARG